MATTAQRQGPPMPFHPAAFAAARPYFYPWAPFVPPAGAWGGQYPPMYHPYFLPAPQTPRNSSSTALVLHSSAQVPPEDGLATPGPSTCRALIKFGPPTPRDTPASYPCPPTDDPDNPPVPIHPYLYELDCPVSWDVRTNMRHKARRTNGEPLSTIALKAAAINAAGMNHNTMKIVCFDVTFPWTITVSRATGITVGDVLMDIAVALNVEVTDAEMWIAGNGRLERAEAARVANIGTGALRMRDKEDPLRRVDFLGTRTKFRGLVHSSAKEYEALVQKKVHGHEKGSTWILVLGDREEPAAEAQD